MDLKDGGDMIQVKFVNGFYGGKFKVESSADTDVDLIGNPREKFIQRIQISRMYGYLEGLYLFPCSGTVKIRVVNRCATTDGKIIVFTVDTERIIQSFMRMLSFELISFGRRYPKASFEINYHQTMIAR